MKKCLILANGQPPKRKVFEFLKTKGYETLICADGGANSAVKLNLIPDYIIGDLDSIKAEVYDYYFDKCEIVQIKRQNNTDVEKCIKFAIKKKYDEIILLGATGDRLDHSLCNLGIVLKYFEKIKIRIIHQRSLLEAFEKDVTMKTVPKEIISVYGFGTKIKITSQGLKYQLKNVALTFGKKESTSNMAAGSEAKLQIKGGHVFVIRDFDTLRKYGLF